MESQQTLSQNTQLIPLQKEFEEQLKQSNESVSKQQAVELYKKLVYSEPIYLITQDGSQPVPLKQIAIESNIFQSICNSVMTQHYINEEIIALETVFIFPLDIDAAISQITIEFTLEDGSKTSMQSVIGEREKLESKYSDAVSQGKTAVIGTYTQSNRDMIRINIGNFPPKSTAILKIYYVQQLEVDDLSYCYRVPMTYIPKYLGNIGQYIKSGHQYIGQEKDELIDAQSQQKREQIIKEIYDQQVSCYNQGESAYIWDIKVNVQMLGKIRRLVSRNHQIEALILNEEENKAQVLLGLNIDKHKVPLQDFILLIRDELVDQPTVLSCIDSKLNEQAIVVNLLPDLTHPKIKAKFSSKVPQNMLDSNPNLFYKTAKDTSAIKEGNENVEEDDDYVDLKPQEFIFLIDRSGSMSGNSIKLAVEALKLFIHSLPLGSRFNIVSYGSNHSKMFNCSSVEYTEESLEEADIKLASFQADMGGTEIFKPLQDVLKQPMIEGLERQIYLLTDGAVSNTKEIIELIRSYQGKVRVNTFGIGSGASTELIKDGAVVGQGHYSFIYNLQEIEQKVIAALQKDFLDYYYIKTIDLMNNEGKLIKTICSNESVQAGQILQETLVLSLSQEKDKDLASEFKMTLLDPNTQQQKAYKYQIQHIGEQSELSSSIFKICAKDQLRRRETENKDKVSIKYQVLHQSTAMFMCEKIMNQQTSEMKIRRIPLTTNHQYKAFQVFLKTLTGKQITLDAKPFSTILDLKLQVQEQEGIPTDQQRMIFPPKQVNDYQTLNELNVVSGSMLYLVLRLRGGDGGSSQSLLSIVNLTTKSNVQVSYDHGRTLDSIRNDLINKQGTSLEDLKIFINGKIVPQNDVRWGKTLHELNVDPSSSMIGFKIINYKAIVFCQNALGQWTQKLYSTIKQKNLQELLNYQETEVLKNLSEAELLTLVGMKLLITEFSRNKNEWKLVMQKGRNILKQKFEKTEEQINQYLENVRIELA